MCLSTDCHIESRRVFFVDPSRCSTGTGGPAIRHDIRWPAIQQMSSVQNPEWMMILGDSTTFYTGDYNNPIGESFLTKQYFMEWRDFEHCSNVECESVWVEIELWSVEIWGDNPIPLISNIPQKPWFSRRCIHLWNQLSPIFLYEVIRGMAL